MDYVKNQKEAIAIVKQMVADGQVAQDIAEKYFPELKESEDKQSKNWILEYLYDGLRKSDEQFKDQFKAAIAWLEKQGEQKPILDVEIPFGAKDSELEEASYNIPNGYHAEIEDNKVVIKKGEQKPADKVEPKFHEGEWIINSQGTLRHIINVDKGGYQTDGGWLTHDTYEKAFHLWTIQDAKDGDVLAAEPIEGYQSPFVAIYTKQNEEDFDSYCFIGFDGKFYKGENGHSTEEIHPATKEQRDTLEKAMADAGYTFDFDKKKLKKIEQKPVEWSEEDEERLQSCLKILQAKGIMGVTETINTKWLKSLKDRVLPQPKPEWSEEDEKMLNDIIMCGEHHCYLDARSIYWLKSLRPQKQQEWSKDDEIILEGIIGAVSNQKPLNKYQLEWLNSLRPQKFSNMERNGKNWKPSDEQMKALSNAGNSFRPFEECHKVLWSLYNDLKKLREE